MKRRASSGLRTFVVSLLAFAQILIAIPMATFPPFLQQKLHGVTPLCVTLL